MKINCTISTSFFGIIWGNSMTRENSMYIIKQKIHNINLLVIYIQNENMLKIQKMNPYITYMLLSNTFKLKYGMEFGLLSNTLKLKYGMKYSE